MKLKQMALTLLICMISFAGFSHTTTDLCQDSNHDLITLSIDKVGVHGVAGLFIMNSDQKIKKETNVSSSRILAVKAIKPFGLFIPDYQFEDRQENVPDQLKSRKLKKTKVETFIKTFCYRLARDGENYQV